MTDREAQELIRMVESAWHMDLGTARGMWRTELMMWHAETATKAIAELGRRANYKIRLADVVEVMEMWERQRKEEEKEQARREAERMAEQRGIEEKNRHKRPEWTFVWAWGRFYRDPRETRWFPQQVPPEIADQLPAAEVLTTAEYEGLRNEWIAVGSPKEKIPGTVLSTP